VVPLIEVDRRPVGDGRAGERTRVLMETLAAAARREDARHNRWTTSVYGST
jgi:branched-chain amino acid aminotransferase